MTGAATSSDQVCAGCGKPLKAQTFHGARPSRQRVFVLRNGRRWHVQCALLEQSPSKRGKMDPEVCHG